MEHIVLDNEYAYKKNKPIRTADDMTKIFPDKKINTIPMDEEWKNNCKKNHWWYKYADFQSFKSDEENKIDILSFGEKNFEKLFELKKKLLSLGGESVCLPVYEEDIVNILSRGQIWYGDKTDLMKGEPCHCHSNSCNLWENNKDKTRIVTGYALTPDGMWRQHSWLIHRRPRQNRVVETTVKRILYYGFVMTQEECEKFCYENY